MLRKLYHKIKRSKERKMLEIHAELCQDSYYGGSFFVNFLAPKKNRLYMKTGSHSVIDGTFIFEKDTGFVQLGDRVHIGNRKTLD